MASFSQDLLLGLVDAEGSPAQFAHPSAVPAVEELVDVLQGDVSRLQTAVTRMMTLM